MKISWKNSLLVAFKCIKITQWDLIFVLNKSESLTKAFQWIQSSESSGTLLKTKCQKKMDIFFQKDTEPFQAELGFFGLFLLWGFFFPLMCSFAISRQLLFRTCLNMYERLLNSHVHFRLEHAAFLWQNSY